MVYAAKDTEGWGIFRSIDKAKRSTESSGSAEFNGAKSTCDLGDLERQIDAVRSESLKCSSVKSDLENEVHILRGKLASSQVNIVDLEKKLEQARKQISDLQREHVSINRQISTKDATIASLNTTAQQAEKALRISHSATNSLLLEFLSTLSEVQVMRKEMVVSSRRPPIDSNCSFSSIDELQRIEMQTSESQL